jgi:predicted phage tail protein
MKRKVYLDGELGEKYGKELTIRANSFSDVIRCLQANYPDIRQYLIDCHEKDIGFLCEVAGKPLTVETELLLQYPEGSMYICPQPMGSKSGGGKILAAIALITIAIITQQYYLAAEAAVPTGTTATGFASWGGKLAFAIGSLGVNLAITGIMQLMAPDPATDEQDESYLFQGSGQTIIEGDPVPVLYGKLRVPGRPVSIAIQNQRQKFTNTSKATIGSPTPVNENNPNVDDGVNPAPYYDNTQDLPQEFAPVQGYTAVGGSGVGGGAIKIDFNRDQF